MKILNMLIGIFVFLFSLILSYVLYLITDPFIDTFTTGMLNAIFTVGVYLFYVVMCFMVPYNYITKKELLTEGL